MFQDIIAALTAKRAEIVENNWQFSGSSRQVVEEYLNSCIRTFEFFESRKMYNQLGRSNKHEG